MALAIGKAWTDTIADVQRRFGEFALPAAAFVFMPWLLIARFADEKALGEQGALLAESLGSVVGVIGQAAIMLLILFPGTDVGTAIRRSLHVAHRTMLASLTLAVLMLPLLVLMPSDETQQVSAGNALLLLVLAPVVAYVALRLSLVVTAIVAEASTLPGAFQRSWKITAGNIGRILVISAVLGLIFLILFAIAQALGIALTGGDLAAPSFVTELLTAIVITVGNVFFAVLYANIYRQLAA